MQNYAYTISCFQTMFQKAQKRKKYSIACSSCTNLALELESLRTEGFQGRLTPYHTSTLTHCEGQAL